MLVVALLGVCVLLFGDVKTDYNHSIDFSQCKKYSLIELDVDAALEGGGLRKSDASDLGVAAFGSTQNQQTLATTTGAATNTLSGDPEKNEENLASAVEGMFKNFPPESKG
jgi:hypothetical protein